MKRSHIGPAFILALLFAAAAFNGPAPLPGTPPTNLSAISTQLTSASSVLTGGGPTAPCNGYVISMQPEVHVLRDAKFTSLVTICNPYPIAIKFVAFLDEGTNAIIHQANKIQRMTSGTWIFGGAPNRYTGGWMTWWTGTIPAGGHVNFYDYLQVGPKPFNSALWNVDVYTNYDAARFVGHQVLIIDDL